MRARNVLGGRKPVVPMRVVVSGLDEVPDVHKEAGVGIPGVRSSHGVMPEAVVRLQRVAALAVAKDEEREGLGTAGAGPGRKGIHRAAAGISFHRVGVLCPRLQVREGGGPQQAGPLDLVGGHGTERGRHRGLGNRLVRVLACLPVDHRTGGDTQSGPKGHGLGRGWIVRPRQDDVIGLGRGIQIRVNGRPTEIRAGEVDPEQEGQTRGNECELHVLSPFNFTGFFTSILSPPTNPPRSLSRHSRGGLLRACEVSAIVWLIWDSRNLAIFMETLFKAARILMRKNEVRRRKKRILMDFQR